MSSTTPSFTAFTDVSADLPDVRGGLREAAGEAFMAFGTGSGGITQRAESAAVAGIGSLAMQSAGYLSSPRASRVISGVAQNTRAFNERRGGS